VAKTTKMDEELQISQSTWKNAQEIVALVKSKYTKNAIPANSQGHCSKSFYRDN
jgi:hypothetical protein